MGSAGDTTEDLILDAMFGDGRAANMPDTIYFALYTVTPGDTGGGTEVSGASVTAYARVSMPNDDTTWDAAAGGEKRNLAEITWDTATDDWGTIVAWAIHTTATVGMGEPVVWGALDAPTPITSGATARFVTNGLVIYAD